jgi:hypothetical protein
MFMLYSILCIELADFEKMTDVVAGLILTGAVL